MSHTLQEERAFTRNEWELLSGLLERERRELHSEIHHAQSSVFREKLRARMEVVQDLIRRFRHSPPS